MAPTLLYQADLAKPNFFADPAQAAAIEHVQRLYEQLQALQSAAPQKKHFAYFVQKMLNKKEKKRV
nr:AFG1/ZapE family ATPase [Psychromonas antarctica]